MRAHSAALSEVEIWQFLSEKLLTRRCVIDITLMSGIGFAAKNLQIYNQKGVA